MKRTLPLILLCAGFSPLMAQDIPLFSQKLTNAFIYNPSSAGSTFGSATFSHRQLWSGVQGAPRTNFLSLHTPFNQHRSGLGLNFYQDNIGVTETLYASGAFAYHVHVTDDRMLSFGVSAEYNNLRVNLSKADVIDGDDALLNSFGATSHVDFSFGATYKAKYFRLGGSANRLTSLVDNSDSIMQFPAFYSGQLAFMVPLANSRDLLEPMVTYRAMVQGEAQVDAGLFYTYNDMATLGGSYRSGGAVNVTAAFKLNKRLLLGYSRDVYTSDINKGVGATNEFTIRFDFRDERFYTNARNARVINTRAIAHRRKTVSMYQAGRGPMQKSNRYRKHVRKNAFKSPNYRISSSKKLMTVKRKRRN